MKSSNNISPRIFVGLDITEDISFDIIVELVCKEFGADREIVLSRTRLVEFLRPRQVIQYFCRKYLKVQNLYRKKNNRKMSLRIISELTNVTNHATILSSIKLVNNLIDTEKDFKQKIEAIKALIDKYNLIVNKNKKDA